MNQIHDQITELAAERNCSWRNAACLMVAEKATHQEKYGILQRAIENFLARPGCNNSQRALALRKLQWALDEAEKS